MDRAREEAAGHDSRHARTAAAVSVHKGNAQGAAHPGALAPLPPLPPLDPVQEHPASAARWHQSAHAFVTHLQEALAELAPRPGPEGVPTTAAAGFSGPADSVQLSFASETASMAASHIVMQPTSGGAHADSSMFSVPVSGASSGRNYQSAAAWAQKQPQAPLRATPAARKVAPPARALGRPATYPRPENLRHPAGSRAQGGAVSTDVPARGTYVHNELDTLSGHLPNASFAFDNPGHENDTNSLHWGPLKARDDSGPPGAYREGSGAADIGERGDSARRTQRASSMGSTWRAVQRAPPGVPPQFSSDMEAMQGGSVTRLWPAREDAKSGKGTVPSSPPPPPPPLAKAMEPPSKEAKEPPKTSGKDGKGGGKGSAKSETVVDIKADKEGPSDKWAAYETSAAENPVLPYWPRVFFKLRWKILGRNPLAMTFGLWQYTLGEVLACIAIVSQFLWVLVLWVGDVRGMRSDVGTTGAIAAFMLMLVYFTAMHANGVLLLLLGLPFERALPWHKMLAWSSTAQGLIHGFAFYVNGRRIDSIFAGRQHYAFDWWTHGSGMEITGWIISIAMLVLIITAMSWMKQKRFAAFYRIHIIFAATTTIATLLHGFGTAYSNGIMPYSLPGAALWILDLLLRAIFMNRLTTGTSARVRCLHPPGSKASAQAIVELRMPRDNRSQYFAGQWVFLCVPQLGLLHWHPFTIASQAADDELMLHIGAGGNWTTRLAELAQKQKHVKAYIEGPYGSPKIDIHSDKYKCFLIVGSGLGWTFSRSMKRQLLREATRGRPIKSIRSIAIVRELAASALRSCWGWDLREDQGEKWPKGLQALEEVYLTGKQPPKEQDVFEAASCGIKPAWSDAAVLTPEGSALLSRGVSLFNGSQAEMSARSALLKLDPSPRTSHYVPPMRPSIEDAVGVSPFDGGTQLSAVLSAPERSRSRGANSIALGPEHRVPSRQSLVAAKDALGEPETNSVLQPWDLSDHLAGALTQRSRGGLSRSMRDITELAVAIEDESQQRAASRATSRAASRSRHASRPSSPGPVYEAHEHPRRCKSATSNQLRSEGGTESAFQRTGSLRRVRWPDEEPEADPVLSTESRGRRRGEGRPVGESGALQGGAPEISPPNGDVGAEPEGRRPARTRSGRRGTGHSSRDSGSLGSQQGSGRSSATLRQGVVSMAQQQPPPNASVPPLARHRSHASMTADGSFISLRDLYSNSSSSTFVAARAQAPHGPSAASTAAPAQQAPFATDPVVSGDASSASEPVPVPQSPPLPTSQQAPTPNLRDGPAEMLLDSGASHQPTRPSAAKPSSVLKSIHTQRQLLTKSNGDVTQRAAESGDSPSVYGSLPGVLASSPAAAGQLDSDWHGVSVPLSSDHGDSRRSSFDPHSSITRHLPGALSTLGSPHKATHFSSGPGKERKDGAVTRPAPDAAFGSVASVHPPNSARSGGRSGRSERLPPAQPGDGDAKRPKRGPPVVMHGSAAPTGAHGTETRGADSAADSGSSFMAPLMNWTRARAHAGRAGVGSFFGGAPAPGPRDLEWGDPAEGDWHDDLTPRSASPTDEQPWLQPAQLSWADNEGASLVNSAMLRSTRSLRRTSVSRSLAQRLNHQHGTDGGADDIRFRRRRPDFVKIFDDAQAEARRLGEDRVAVLVCGNEGVLKRCLKQCAAHRGDVRFDCHYEAFSFG